MAQHIKNNIVTGISTRNARGFTLVELMIGAGIMAFAFTGILNMLFSSVATGEMDRATNKAYNAINAKMEELKNEAFANLDGYDASVFDLDGFSPTDAQGRIEVTDYQGSPDCKQVRVVASYRAGARVIGEDTNLNGALDTTLGEDANGNNSLDSPLEMVTLFSNA